MKMNRNVLWTGILGLTIWFAPNRALPADADKDGPDFAAEDAQAAKEDADQAAERETGIKGKYQRTFSGTVYMLKQGSSEQYSPDVVGLFITDDKDPKPKRTYQMKLMRPNAGISDVLKKFDRKQAKIVGKLRVLDANGEGKYLIVDSVSVEGGAARVPERVSASGL